MNPDRAISICLRGCSKTFLDGTRALEPLNLEIVAGETLVLLGPSGCGKTTTLRMIAGLEHPDAGGTVLFDGEDVTALGIEARNIGMVFQSYALFPNMTVAENVAYGLRIQKMRKPQMQERVREMLAMMRIEALAERSIDQISGGQRQRVALARALAVRPRALLLDEPLTALDAQLREVLRVEISQLLRELRMTTVYVTHDQTEAMALGDRIMVMSHGRVEQLGAPREIYHQPASAFVAGFVGSMNRLRGSVGVDGFDCAGGRLSWHKSGVEEILFRPEDVRIVEAPVADLTGRVTASVFLGERTQLLVDVGDAAPLVVFSDARKAHRVGDTLHMQVDPRGLLTL